MDSKPSTPIPSDGARSASPKSVTSSRGSPMAKQKTAVMGPKTLNEKLDLLTGAVQVDLWKNIPKPVCEATSNAFECIESLKKFLLHLDSRLTNLSYD